MIASKRFVVGVIALGLASTAVAMSFSVTPLRLDLAGNRSASVEVSNPGDSPVDLEVKAESWTQVDGKDVHTDTADLTFYPAKFTLAPHSKRVIRVGTVDKGSRPDTQKDYRLYITELPPPHQDKSGENVVIRTSFGIPVFVYQPTARAQLNASVDGGGAGVIKIKLANQGKAHAHLKSITSDPAGIQSGQMDEWYVLPGASHLYSLPISGNVCNQSQAKLHISLDQGKPVDVPISIPSGVCKAS